MTPLRESFAFHNPDTCIVVVRVHEMKNLPSDKNTIGLPDPYCELHLVPKPVHGDQAQRTSNKTASTNPKWSHPEKFSFKVVRLNASKVVLSVFHFLPVRASTPLCEGVVHLKDFAMGKPASEKEIPLVDPENGAAAGSALVSVSIMTPEAARLSQEHVIYEFQRWQVGKDWGYGKGYFLPTDLGRWSTLDGKRFGDDIEAMAPPIPAGWQVDRGWQTGVTDQDPEGWEYSPDMRSNYWYPEGAGNVALCVRRRVWSRIVKK